MVAWKILGRKALEQAAADVTRKGWFLSRVWPGSSTPRGLFKQRNRLNYIKWSPRLLTGEGARASHLETVPGFLQTTGYGMFLFNRPEE